MSDTHYDLTKGQTGEAEKLDVEDEDSRQQRLRMSQYHVQLGTPLTRRFVTDDVLMHLDKSTSYHQADNAHSFDFGDRKTFMVEPPLECTYHHYLCSSRYTHQILPVLSRIQAFLPEFAASTAEITRKAEEDPDSVDIEKLQGEGPYIRMVHVLNPLALLALTNL